MLGVLVCVYPTDLPFERRDYMKVSSAAFGKAEMYSRSNSRLSLSSSYAGDPNDIISLEKAQRKKLPILTAKVT